MTKKQCIFNIIFGSTILLSVVIMFVCFNDVYESYINGTIKVYYRSVIVDGNIDNLHWNYGRGDAPIIGGDMLNGHTAYLYNISDNQCDVIIVSEKSLYGENISIDHFDSDDVGKAQLTSKQRIDAISFLGKELFEYSELRSVNLTENEIHLRIGYYAIILLCVILLLENIIFFAIKRKKTHNKQLT